MDADDEIGAPPNPDWDGVRDAPDDSELRFRVRRFLEYVTAVRSGRIRRLDRDVVLSFAQNIEEAIRGND